MTTPAVTEEHSEEISVDLIESVSPILASPKELDALEDANGRNFLPELASYTVLFVSPTLSYLQNIGLSDTPRPRNCLL